jgi:predicted DNA binding protein
MTTDVVLRVPLEPVGLAATADRLCDPHFRVEENAMTNSNDALHLWLTADDPEAIDDALDADPSVEVYEHLDTQRGERLYRIGPDTFALVREIIDRCDGTITEAYGGPSGWTFEVRFRDQENLSALERSFDRFDVQVDYRSVKPLGNPDDGTGDGLTETQRRTVELAIESGYYDVPRDTTLVDLAEELGISHQAVSERLRRAERRLATEETQDRVGAMADSGA